MSKNLLKPGHVVIAYDATKDHRGEQELKRTVNNIRLHGGILHVGDTLTLLGILHKVPHPMGYHMQASPISFTGTNVSAMKDEVSKKLDTYVKLLQPVAAQCENEKVDIEVRITAGTPTKKVVLQEIAACNATWVILDRYLRRDLRFYLKQIPSKVALIHDDLSVEVLKPHTTTDFDAVEPELFLSMFKPVPLSTVQDNMDNQQSTISCRSYPASFSSLGNSSMSSNFSYNSLEHSSSSGGSVNNFNREKSGRNTKSQSTSIKPIYVRQHKDPSKQPISDAPILCIACGMRTELDMKDYMKFSFSEIQLATNYFSSENLLGEGGFGLVYKGELKDRKLIAAKVRKEESNQGYKEFQSEVHVLSFARHKNIVMLLGYCCKENFNILVYEYICNNSLEWHLFDKTQNVLEWHHRYAIAIGTAKGLRYLHEECRGGPIIHRDMRPSNILLTHDFVPMLGDFGLAKWKTNGPIQTRILGTFGYLAPEYAENGIVSVRIDVYSFGIVLIQLISGRKVVESNKEDQQQSLRQWAEPIIEKLALHKLIDPRIGDCYDTYELYQMARTAYLCVQSNPELRPSMGEVVRLLEGESVHFRDLADQFIPHFQK